MDTVATANPTTFAITKQRTRFFGLSSDECVQAFFGGNAIVALVVLALITFFLFREGFDFFRQERWLGLTVYRQAGLEYVDYIRGEEKDHSALTRYLGDVRLQAFTYLTTKEKLSPADANQRLAAFDTFAGSYSDAIDPVRSISSDLTDVAVAIKTKFGVNDDRKTERDQLNAEGKSGAADKVAIANIDVATELKPILDSLPAYKEANVKVRQQLDGLIASLPKMPTAPLDKRMTHFAELTRAFVATFPEVEHNLETWDYRKPVPFYAAAAAFVFGREWLTASFWQDWYGIVPLLVGSLMVSCVALVIAVPLGVGAAIYINQIARPIEQKVIKPGIEFISAFPSVVLGFFGIAVLGEALRQVSHVSWLSWLPGFPIAERLNVLTAGCLLALIAVPTIFTLAEDALNNVPRSFKEASFALGANRLQTIIKITLPASLSGIVSAVLLGFGRVIGETMVVLLCAGNRIAIPDFTSGLGAFTQPVHTMTGIIAQEMGEVVRGSIHYRALFMVGIVLFFLSLLINYGAQRIVHRYRLPAT